MKLEYKVLCIDDKISLLDDPKMELITVNEPIGIETKFYDVHVIPSNAREKPDDFSFRVLAEIERKFSDDSFDLVLVDLNMPGELSGSDIIAIIRGKHSIYRPIIFYSDGALLVEDGDSDPNLAVTKIKDDMKKHDLEGKGIFVVSRDNIASKAREIFEAMHKEEHKVNSVRGLLMDRVSEFDASVVALVQDTALLEMVPAGPAKNKALSDFKRYLKEDRDKADALITKINQLDITRIPGFLADNSKNVSTYRKGYLLKSILRQIGDLKSCADILSEGIDGENSIREIRNVYGHTTAEELDKIHCDDKCIHIRKETRRQINNLDQVRKSLE